MIQELHRCHQIRETVDVQALLELIIGAEDLPETGPRPSRIDEHDAFGHSNDTASPVPSRCAILLMRPFARNRPGIPPSAHC